MRLRQTAPSIHNGEDDNGTDSLSSEGDKGTRLSKLLSQDLSVPAVLLAAFLNLLGFTMTGPIQPALGKHFGLPLGASYGSLLSAYPLGMLFGVLLWPTLSDVLGRRAVMGLTLAGSGCGLALQGYGIHAGWSLERFLSAKVLTGFFSGNSPVSKAYLADRGSAMQAEAKDGSNKGILTRYLAWKDAASTMAFILGPALGGLAYQLSGVGGAADNSTRIARVIFCSAIASLAASASVLACVREKRSMKVAKTKAAPDDATEVSETSESGPASSTKLEKDAAQSNSEIVACPLGTRLWTGVVSVACVTGLYHVADSTFFAFFPVLLQNKLGFGTQAVGMAFTASAVLSFATSAFVSSRFLRAFGPVAACATGLGAVGTGLATLGCASSLPPGSTGLASLLILLASILYYVGVPLYGPSVPTMLMQCVPPDRRGAVMGLDGTVNTIADRKSVV